MRNATQGLELWGGLECSIVRIKQTWRNQVVETGHLTRDTDLDAVAALGIRTLRYPVLWEQVSPQSPQEADFTWHDRRMAQMRRLGITPMVGLLHHGSGPAYTRLLDPRFPTLFASYAKQVAERYPDVTDFTPINEPLTTARFVGLYGHWYPHKRTMRAFARMLVNQCRAICDAMKAIRSVTPGARLIQTEDLGRVFSTPLLAYQADYENERRWLSFDLLHGRVDRHHPWHSILIQNGIAETELDAFCDDPCPPDIIGINHYATSDRFLEHRPAKLPVGMRFGGNRRHRYADLEALRVKEVEDYVGPEARFRETWERYGRPMAITECHHGSTRDEQLRWLDETWKAAKNLRAEGVDIRAVTIWALFGLMDWKSLLLRRDFDYEPGAFDIRSSPPRLTALGRAASELAGRGSFQHPVLDMPGWWRRGQRHYNHSTLSLDDEGARSVLVLSEATDFSGHLLATARHRGLRPVFLSATSINAAPALMLMRRAEEARAWSVIVDVSDEAWLGSTTASSIAMACGHAGLEVSFVLGGRVSAEGHRFEREVLRANRQALILRCEVEPAEADCREGGAGEGTPAASPVLESEAATFGHAALYQGLLDLLVDRDCGLWQAKMDQAHSRPSFTKVDLAGAEDRADPLRHEPRAAKPAAVRRPLILPVVHRGGAVPSDAQPQNEAEDETPALAVGGALG
ncbi:family 1 glycosylhydrolase [Neorhizobium lilium]|uniref:family 1 glycosylhydrolase n=1 Tax=Neorhizobium lilium TaxID=2503024 RepID=UPI0013E2A74F|nr:family 1 glycosylhydrolase [Neorhizobium lilium]